MGKEFIARITSIIETHIADEKFGVTDLARALNISRSQLLRRVKSETGVSVNKFIRDQRLTASVKLLREEEHTVSEIAYLVGFSSPSYFNKCFHEHYGCTPGEYLKLHPEEESNTILTSKEVSEKQGALSRLLIGVVGLAVVIGLGYFGYAALFNESTTRIAVLPISNYSYDADLDYLADSFTDAITLELAKNDALEVVSRTTAMLYKESNKKITEIAEELDVDLLLEGSFLVDTDSIRVVVQLIEPKPKEKHVWQKGYSHVLHNLLLLTNTVSSDIAAKVGGSVSPGKNSAPDLPEVKVVNPAAYDLYLRGKYLYNQQNTASIRASLEYLQESIAIDSTYAPAHVTLGDAYITLNKIIPNNIAMLEHRDQCRKAIDKALDLDPNLASAYIAKGNIAGAFDWQWDTMKELAEKGLELDPNNARGYIVLSNYHLINGHYDKARAAVQKAKALDPLNKRICYLVGERLMLLGDMEAAKYEFEQVLELDPNYGLALDGLGYVYHAWGDFESALRTWSRLQKVMGNSELASYFLEHSFDDSVKTLLSKVEVGNPIYCTNPTILAQANSFIFDQEASLNFLDIAFKYRHEDLPLALLKPNFREYYDDPRFMEFVNLVGVTLPPVPIKD